MVNLENNILHGTRLWPLAHKVAAHKYLEPRDRLLEALDLRQRLALRVPHAPAPAEAPGA